jgi:hypothetical protein
MQTFVPYGIDFCANAFCLDNKRLISQCKEAAQILSTLVNKTKPWSNHPIVRMWREYEYTLSDYGIAMTNEYNRRFNKVHANEAYFCSYICNHKEINRDPVWLNNALLTNSHRQALVYKDKIHYAPYFPSSPPVLNYVWYDPDSRRYYRGKRSQPKTLVWL